ncbi:hypothetical protein D3C81_1611390 [compost metagenome]
MRMSSSLVHSERASTVFMTSPLFGDFRSKVEPAFTASMNSSVMLMPWCRFRDLRLKSPEGLRISRNSSISGWWMSR